MGHIQPGAGVVNRSTVATAGHAATRDWRSGLRRAWPFAAMVLAAVLWWPTGFVGRASWMRLPLMQAENGVMPLSGGELFLGTLVAAALVAALVPAPWMRLGMVTALTAAAWMLTEPDVVFAPKERVVLAALAGLGMVIGLVLGAHAMRGVVQAATLLALVSGLSPATWPRGLLLAVALALPFWAARPDRVGPTVVAVVRVVATWLAAVVLSLSLWAGFASLEVGALGDPGAAAPVVARGAVDLVRERGLEIIGAAPQIYTSWIWVAIAVAVGLAVVANGLRRRPARSSA